MKRAGAIWAWSFMASLTFSLPAQAAIENSSLENPAFNRGMLALAIALAYIIFTVWIFKRHRRRMALPASLQAKAGNRESGNTETASSNTTLPSSKPAKPEPSMLVAYASQSGHARELAIKTALSLQESGIHTRCFSLDEVDSDLLQRIPRALFVVSTTGEGDAPDNARGFVQRYMNPSQGQALNLDKLQYGILGLGDSSYQYFCGFAHELDGWLQHVHALPLFDLVQVDGDDPGALRHWQYQLGLLADNAEMADWQAPQYDSWRLVMRQQLNPGSEAGAVYHLGLKPEQSGTRWQAGDIAEIGPRNSAASVTALLDALGLTQQQTEHLEDAVDVHTLAQSLSERLLPHDAHELAQLQGMSPQTLLQTLKPLPHREYSIASLPGDGQLELVIRQTHYPDGRPGLGSGWLTQFVGLGDKVALRIRENPSFHPPAADQPMILIGNGTGIAGLRAHLKFRAANSSAPSWLLFGERQQTCDYYFQTEIKAWLKSGVLQRVDAVFSRDQAEKAYVQHVLAQQAELLREWVKLGAVIYVCGSASRMAPAVHSVLLHALGEPLLTEMALHGRYRRDVY